MPEAPRRPRPMLAPNPLNNTLADVPGPRPQVAAPAPVAAPVVAVPAGNYAVPRVEGTPIPGRPGEYDNTQPIKVWRRPDGTIIRVDSLTLGERQQWEREKNSGRTDAEIRADESSTANTASMGPYWASQNQYRDKVYDEGVRQYDKTLREQELARTDRRDQAREALREQARQYDLTFGADLLKTGASMRGALEWAQGDMYAQGVSQGGMSPFVAALQTGRPVRFGGGTATSGHPTPLTVGTMAARLSGGSANGGGGTDQYGRPLLSPEVQAGVDAAGGVYERGLANVPQGFFENMTKGQRNAFRSAGAYKGRDVESEEEYWRRSRPGQGRGTAA